MASEEKQVNRSTKPGPYEGTLLELVKRLQDQSFLFVIAIAILLIALAVMASALGTSDLRFIVIVIACLALTAIIVYCIVRLVKVETQQTLQESEINALEFAVKGILTKHEMNPLRGLNGLAPVLMPYEPELYGYLHRLDGLNFIQPNRGYGLYDIVKEHRDDERFPYEKRPKFDLKKYVYITDEGKKYLNTLNAILKKSISQNT